MARNRTMMKARRPSKLSGVPISLHPAEHSDAAERLARVEQYERDVASGSPVDWIPSTVRLATLQHKIAVLKTNTPPSNRPQIPRPDSDSSGDQTDKLLPARVRLKRSNKATGNLGVKWETLTKDGER
jgi:hypothetical protein